MKEAFNFRFMPTAGSADEFNMAEGRRSWYHLNSWSRVLQKLRFPQAEKRFTTFYENHSFTKTRHRSICSARWFQSTPFHPVSLESTLILSYHLRRPSGFFPSKFSHRNPVYIHVPNPLSETLPARYDSEFSIFRTEKGNWYWWQMLSLLLLTVIQWGKFRSFLILCFHLWLDLRSGHLPSCSPTKTLYAPLPDSCYMSCPSKRSWFDHPNIWWRMQSIKLLVM